MSLMIPYSIVFVIDWMLFLAIWFRFELPLGPGAGIYYQFEAASQ